MIIVPKEQDAKARAMDTARDIAVTLLFFAMFWLAEVIAP